MSVDEKRTGTSEVEATPESGEREERVAPRPGEEPKTSEVDGRPDEPVRGDPRKNR